MRKNENRKLYLNSVLNLSKYWWEFSKNLIVGQVGQKSIYIILPYVYHIESILESLSINWTTQACI